MKIRSKNTILILKRLSRINVAILLMMEDYPQPNVALDIIRLSKKIYKDTLQEQLDKYAFAKDLYKHYLKNKKS